ncbi:MAG: glycosyltransferase family 4 protein [Acidimicrobiia bacterium]
MSNTSDRVRVTHLIHDLGPGGAEHVLVDLATVAEAAGIDMSVVSMLPLGRFRYPRLLRESGVRVESLDLAAWWDPRGPRRLRRLLAALAPEILHSHLKHADVVAGRVARPAGILQVSTLHVVEDSVGPLGAWKRGIAMRWRKRTARRTIAVSDALRDWYLAESGADPDSVVTIRNGVPDPVGIDREEVSAVRRELGIGDDRIVALTIAVMRPGKGHDVLLDAVKEVDDDRLVFLLAGDGSEAKRLWARAAGDHRIVFTGFREDVPLLFAAADLVVHPSLGDALPTSLIHALAAGLPIVASDIGGIPEIVTPGAGFLVPPGDPAALASAITRLAADEAGRRLMEKRSRERFEEEFEAAAWARRLRSLYSEVLNRT